jgi:sulfur-oxidizing protein SoxX
LILNTPGPIYLGALGLALVAFSSAPTPTSAQDQRPAVVAYEIIDFAIPEPLTEIPGDIERGWTIVQDTANATCLICHSMPMPWQPDQGNLAPDLAGVGSRYNAAELRLRLVDPKALNPFTIMPAYYQVQGLSRVQEKYLGKTIYSAQDIEDVIAFLLTLTDK